MDAIDRRLAQVQERIAKERAAGIPDKQPGSGLAHAMSPSTRAINDQRERERKQEMWDAILEYAPELAQLLRDFRAAGWKPDVAALRTPNYKKGPDVPPFNHIVIRIDLEDAKLESRGRKR